MRFFAILALSSAAAFTGPFYPDRDAYPLISGRDAGQSSQDKCSRKKPAVGSKQVSVQIKRPPLRFPSPKVKMQTIKVHLIRKSSSQEGISAPIFPQIMDQLKTGCKEVVDGICKSVGMVAEALKGAANKKDPPDEPKAKK